jgi:gas vesicle protein
MKDQDKVACLVAGLGTGVALGVLFAPRSGKESRRVIREKAQEGRDQMNRTVDKGQDYVKRKGTELLDQANELVDRGVRTVAQQKDRIDGAIQAGVEAYRSTVDAAKPPEVRR